MTHRKLALKRKGAIAPLRYATPLPTLGMYLLDVFKQTGYSASNVAEQLGGGVIVNSFRSL